MAISLAHAHIKPYYRKTITYLTKVFVTLGYFCQTVHAVFFPQPASMETLSHPVTVNQNGRALQTSSFRTVAYLCIGNHIRCWPTPSSTKSSSSFKDKKWYKAITVTSLSTVTIVTFQNFFMVAWLHSWYVSLTVFVATFRNDVTIMVVSPVSRLVMLSANILNSSVLLSSCLIKSWNYLQIGVSFLTDIRISFTLFSLVCPLILSDL